MSTSYQGGGTFEGGTPQTGGMPAPGGIPPTGGYSSPAYETPVTYQETSYEGGATAAPSGRPDVENESLGSLVGQLTSDVSTLMRQEVALAKAELKEEAKKAGKGAGMLGAAGLAGYFVLLFLSLTIMWLLGEVMWLWLAALIVMILWGVAAAVLFVMGRKQLKEVNPKPEQTVETLREDKEWVKAQKS